MSPNPRQVAVQGFGFTPRQVAVQGLFPASNPQPPAGFRPRPREKRRRDRDDEALLFMLR